MTDDSAATTHADAASPPRRTRLTDARSKTIVGKRGGTRCWDRVAGSWMPGATRERGGKRVERRWMQNRRWTPRFILRAVGACVACDRLRIRLLLLSVVVTFAVWALMPVSSPGQTSKQQQLSELQQRSGKARRKIGRKRGTERVLSTRVGYTRTKAGKAAALKGVRGQRARLESTSTNSRPRRVA